MVDSNSNTSNSNSSLSFRSLLAFKPRQVLLSNHNSIATASASITSPEMKEGLNGVLLDFFHRNGFSKTLKRFHQEAHVQTDAAWKASSLHLEDMFTKHHASNVDGNKNTSKKQGNYEAMENEKVHPTNEVTTTKKKKKKVIVSSDDRTIKYQPEVTDKKKKKSGINSGQLSTDNIVNEPETQPKKKKSKHNLVSTTDDAVHESKIENFTKKIKDKKKKNTEKVNLELCTTNEDEVVTEVAQKDKKKKKKPSTDGILNVQPDVTEKEKKSSKKRKRSFSDENENEDEKKTETFKEKKSRKEEINDIETSNKFDGEPNGKVKLDGVKSKKKQSNVTVESKTVNTFQRVKMDEVEFADDKLQDNSYWAKGGAEIGYGAKAQEVLGQVRGRDFRHEKTKKKRGSYRGGLIDQQSHSVKFNYSDEE